MRREWRRGDRPCLELGAPGAFDDTHLLAPFVAYENGRFTMWYSGSRHISESERIYGLGVASSDTGDHFERVRPAPVLEWHEAGGSILTPCLLRNADGTLLREDGRLRMWFSVTHFARPGAPHTLHHASSSDGLAWSVETDVLLNEAYSPTVIRDGDRYRMWFVNVTEHPWTIEYAESPDGIAWERTTQQVFDPERGYDYRNYPFVTGTGDGFEMWFSYVIQARPYKMVGIGCARSPDGIRWTESTENPLISPASDHPWESQYCGSPCVVPLQGEACRIFYASRNRDYPDNKYYAFCSATSSDGA